jgi:fatty aldehyde-generating acyl-ACP reductase
MDKFAFVIHPLDISDFYRKFPFLEKTPNTLIEGIFKTLPPFKVSEIKGIKTPKGEVEGYFIAVPLTAKQMVSLPEEVVTRKIIKAGHLAQKLGANILGLGAFTSVVGDAGVTISQNIDIPVTTGNTYTVLTAIEGVKKAASMLGKDFKESEIVVVGANGSIGNVCARYLAREAKYLTLVSRNKDKLNQLADKIYSETGTAVHTTENINSALKKGDIIITVTSSVDTIIEPRYLKKGAIVCDVSRPRDVSKEVAKMRKDVLIIDGGIVKLPGEVDFGFDFGFPENTSYACMAETILLSLEKRWENFSLGREMELEKIDQIKKMAEENHFTLAGFRSFDKEVSLSKIEEIKRSTRHYRKESV